MAYKFVGKAVPRLEGAEKVSGKMRYAADFEIPARFVRKDFAQLSAPCAHRQDR